MQLFKDRYLNISMLISASWHLIAIYLFTPVLMPDHLRQNSTNISFLGAILDNVSIVAEKSFLVDRISLLQKIEKMRNLTVSDEPLSSPYPAGDIVALREIKEQPVILETWDNRPMLKINQAREVPEIKFPNFFVMGKAKNRIILHKPGLSRIAVLPSEFSSTYSANIKFRISRHGFVENPECIVSSGSSEIDQMAIRYVRKWQFVPDENSVNAQEGVMRVSFVTY